jgi:hypothetical protein
MDCKHIAVLEALFCFREMLPEETVAKADNYLIVAPLQNPSESIDAMLLGYLNKKYRFHRPIRCQQLNLTWCGYQKGGKICFIEM